MYAYKFSGERMTRVRYAFFTRPIKWTNCQKKRRVECLRTRGLGLVVVVNSRVGLEGKETGKTVWFIAFDVSGDRGYTFGWILKRV